MYKTAEHWQRIGTKLRAGVVTPLFSIYSKDSIGIGEIPDLKLLIDWCKKVNISIVQLLPLNDTGFKFTPYDSESAFALDPMYLSLSNIAGIESKFFKKAIEELGKRFKKHGRRIDYEIKKEKLRILEKMFDSIYFPSKKLPKKCQSFINDNKYWMNDYACYRTLKEKHNQQAWINWEEKYKNRKREAILEIEKTEEKTIQFYKWLQWQTYIQMLDSKKYAGKNNVLVLGDLPLLVSADSADVWSHKEYFLLEKATGTPPDIDFVKGQRWSMPPYNWNELEKNEFNYFTQKLKYAENFYDMYRIDHFLGLFRLWIIDNKELLEHGGVNGKYFPENPEEWEVQGRKIIEKMLNSTKMLPCGENLGTVPKCANEALNYYLIPGIEVQRWAFQDFKNNSTDKNYNISMLSTHDTSTFIEWWEDECGTANAEFMHKLCTENGLNYENIKNQLFDLQLSTSKTLRWKPEINSIEKLLEIIHLSPEKFQGFKYVYTATFGGKQNFWDYLKMTGRVPYKPTKKLIYKAIKKCAEAKALFSIQLLQDLLSLGNYFDNWDKTNLRINVPGTISDKNWNVVLPISLEKLLSAPINHTIKKINISAGRS